MNHYKLLAPAVVIMVALAACGSPISDADRAAAKRLRTSAPTHAQQELLAVTAGNLSYSGIYAEPVTLDDGYWEGQPFVAGGASRPAVGLVNGFDLSGDLNGDGINELVVFLRETSGGSGTNTYVAVAGVRDGKRLNLGTALVGDRVQLRGVRIDKARIELEVVQQGPGDAACCPSQLALRSWELTAGGLQELPVEITGSLSLADLADAQWVLTELQAGKPVPAGVKTTLRLDGDRISGSTGCNQYFSSVLPGDRPGEVAISGTGSTRMACPAALMKFETAYLDALARVSRYGFINGRLALTWQADGQVHAMLFYRGNK